TAVSDEFHRLNAKAARDGTTDVRGMATAGLDFPKDTEADIQSSGVKAVMSRIPVVSRFQTFFPNFVTTLRANMFSNLEDNLRSAGIDTTRQDVRESIAKTINLATGSTGTNVPGASSLIAFPKWTVSQLEFLGKAVADGGMEGAYAREAVLKTVGLWTAAAVATNHAQGKPTDWSNGLPTMQIGNQEFSLPGKYGQFAKGIMYAVSGKDPSYLLRSNASPALAMGWDLVTGKDFGGNKANIPNPVTIFKALNSGDIGAAWNNGQYAIRQASPFNVSSIGQQPIGQVALGDLGLKNRLQTPYDVRDSQAIKQFGVPYSQLSPSQIRTFKGTPGNTVPVSTNPAAIKAQGDMAWAKQQNLNDLTQLDQNYQPGQAWRDQYHIVQAAAQARFDTLNQTDPYNGPQNTTPEAQALNDWDATIKQNTVAQKVNWNAVDAWMAQNPDKAALVNNYLSGGKPSTIPSVVAYKAASARLDSSNFFTLKDDAWKNLVSRNPTLSQYPTYTTYVTAFKAQYPTATTTPLQTAYTNAARTFTLKWALGHRQELADAITWGYIQYPTAQQKALAKPYMAQP
ncbi:MAG: hypothetical protein KGL39_54620, partial [Patescibacteria group bacterium]|nr:hypothetical protein [Patescibacteria group bacterium]